jgi:K(+)-stimulated pyrophosphate-energized sodium pump
MEAWILKRGLQMLNMKFLQRAARKRNVAMPLKSLGVFLVASMGALMPTSAMASEGDHIPIHFNQVQNIGLFASLLVGIASVLYGLIFLRGSVMRESPGSDRMQEVGLAIREGALAYLRQQIKTMAIFIVILLLGLIALFWRLGPTIAVGVGACFVAGVAASYGSGYAGMLTAISGNMRTAHAALTGPRRALVVAFRSGAVAGMVTVGMGLIGASVILLAFPSYATSLLVGFGFGASLAALFMRVGGGIFTKAADVGADLVGKVEAGIPEDDPRNPAVIADNVGDNVGDCAGMAADVFESYEVTLVASIVLGAATAAIFDSDTWPRLIVFGLDACAIGLFSSAFSAHILDGSDDASANQMRFLNKGFWTSAILSFVLTGVLAFTTLGGIGARIQTAQLEPTAKFQNDKVIALKAIQADIATREKKQPWEVGADEVLKDPRSVKLGYDPKTGAQTVASLLQTPMDQLPKVPDLTGLTRVTDFNNLSDQALDYSVRAPANPAQPSTPPGFESLASYFGDKGPGEELVAAEIHVVAHIPPQPAQGKEPARAEVNTDENHWLGPMKKKDMDEQLRLAHQQIDKQKSNVRLDLLRSVPAYFYTSPDGRAAVAVDGDIDHPDQLNLQMGGMGANFYKASPQAMNTLLARQNSPTSPPPIPPQGTIEVAVLTHTTVPWYAFWLTLAFGILMSFAIQFLTDFYVSTEKGPTKEVAGVATAGAAPMIIQGFAHAATSSVFTVLAIVVALMCPLFWFNPAIYGGYVLSFYGVALVGVGMLTTTGFILAMDTFGPISDNAQGVFEMSGAAEEHPEAAHILSKLDAVGNTTKALTKGYAIATAVVAAVALFHAYLSGAHLSEIGLRLDVPEIFLGLLIGGAAPYLFASFSINAVGRAAFELINEVRRQFREDSGIMAGTSKPDYARCVAIVTSAAQKELLAPGILAIALPLAVGFGFSIGKPATEINGHLYNLTGAQALGGFLAGAIVSGQLLAVLLSNSGGIWDNAKKLIEDGLHGGKGTEAHRAAVVGDTVGDPFKDTAGPAMNPLIKVMNLVALLVSGFVIQPFGPIVLCSITAICLIALIVSFVASNKGSMSDALTLVRNEELGVPPSPELLVIETPAQIAPVVKKKKLFVEDQDED